MSTTGSPPGGKTIPPPPDPVKRKEQLPWEYPKPLADDADAEQRVRAIMNNPSYIQPDDDLDYLGEDVSRGIRLQLDYHKPEQLLKQHNIRYTVVAFGSTRITERAAAHRKVVVLEQAIKDDPTNKALIERLAVARRILEKSHYYDVARDFGKLVGKAGQGPGDCQVVLMTGGGPGIMEAANRGAWDTEAKTIGLNINLPHEQFPNPYITPGLCFQFRYFALRKLHFLLRAKALVAFPGGFGTIDELFETLTLIQTRKIEPLPVVLIGESFWRRAVDFDFLVEEGVIDPEDLELFWFAETAQDAWDGILLWHQTNGTPLFENGT